MASSTNMRGILGDAPEPVSKPTLMNTPKFIGLQNLYSLTNKAGLMPANDNIRNTLHKYVRESRSKYQLKQKILFSCLSPVLVSSISVLTDILGKPLTKREIKYIPIIVGGIAIRYYNQSYISNDLDVKVFPDIVDGTYNSETVLKNKVSLVVKNVLNSISKSDIRSYLQTYIQYYLFQNIDIVSIKEVMYDLLRDIQGDNVKLDVSFPDGVTDVLKFVCIINEEGREVIYKLGDISMYNPDNDMYTDLINKYYDTHSESVGTKRSHMPPYVSVRVNNQRVNIVDEEFMKFEKPYLIEKLGDNPFFREKFERSLTGLNASAEQKQQFVFLGGKKKSRKNRKRQKNNKKAHNLSSKRKHIAKTQRKVSSKKQTRRMNRK